MSENKIRTGDKKAFWTTSTLPLPVQSASVLNPLRPTLGIWASKNVRSFRIKAVSSENNWLFTAASRGRYDEAWPPAHIHTALEICMNLIVPVSQASGSSGNGLTEHTGGGRSNTYVKYDRPLGKSKTMRNRHLLLKTRDDCKLSPVCTFQIELTRANHEND